MATAIEMQNPATGLVWAVDPPLKGFHFFRFLGYVRLWFVPLLFLKGYRIWGGIGAATCAAVIGLVIMSADKNAFTIPVALYFILGIFFGPKIPKITVQSKLRQGWVFADPDSEPTKQARAIWNV